MTNFTSHDQKYKYSAIHINIRSLPAKHDQLKTLVADFIDHGLSIDFIMICETFLKDMNTTMFPIPGYQFISNNRIHGKGGGVALYIKDTFHLHVRSDLTVNHGTEFESIFVEVELDNNNKLLIGEIYRVLAEVNSSL